MLFLFLFPPPRLPLVFPPPLHKLLHLVNQVRLVHRLWMLHTHCLGEFIHHHQFKVAKGFKLHLQARPNWTPHFIFTLSSDAFNLPNSPSAVPIFVLFFNLLHLSLGQLHLLNCSDEKTAAYFRSLSMYYSLHPDAELHPLHPLHLLVLSTLTVFTALQRSLCLCLPHPPALLPQVAWTRITPGESSETDLQHLVFINTSICSCFVQVKDQPLTLLFQGSPSLLLSPPPPPSVQDPRLLLHLDDIMPAPT